jgi:hypothetical protein
VGDVIYCILLLLMLDILNSLIFAHLKGRHFTVVLIYILPVTSESPSFQMEGLLRSSSQQYVFKMLKQD